MNDTNETTNTEIEEKAVIIIESVSDEELETVDGGRSYGWGGGGWNRGGSSRYYY